MTSSPCGNFLTQIIINPLPVKNLKNIFTLMNINWFISTLDCSLHDKLFGPLDIRSTRPWNFSGPN